MSTWQCTESIKRKGLCGGGGGALGLGIQSLDPLEEKSFGEGEWGWRNLIYVNLILHPWEERFLWRRHRIRHIAGAPQMLQGVIKKKRSLERGIEMVHIADTRYLSTVLIGGKCLYGESLNLDHAQYMQTEATGGKGIRKRVWGWGK